MGIERGEHPVDRALHQRLVIDLVDIVRLDPLVDAHELIELLVGVDVRRGEPGGDRRQERGERDQAGAAEQGGTHGGGDFHGHAPM